MDMDKIYNRIDDKEDMTDAEKREAYFAEEANQEMFGDEFDYCGDCGDK